MVSARWWKSKPWPFLSPMETTVQQEQSKVHFENSRKSCTLEKHENTSSKLIGTVRTPFSLSIYPELSLIERKLTDPSVALGRTFNVQSFLDAASNNSPCLSCFRALMGTENHWELKETDPTVAAAGGGPLPISAAKGIGRGNRSKFLISGESCHMKHSDISGVTRNWLLFGFSQINNKTPDAPRIPVWLRGMFCVSPVSEGWDR